MFSPLRLLAEKHGGAVLLRDLVLRLRCKGCGNRPNAIDLVEQAAHGPGRAGAPDGWRVPLVDKMSSGIQQHGSGVNYIFRFSIFITAIQHSASVHRRICPARDKIPSLNPHSYLNLLSIIVLTKLVCSDHYLGCINIVKKTAFDDCLINFTTASAGAKFVLPRCRWQRLLALACRRHQALFSPPTDFACGAPDPAFLDSTAMPKGIHINIRLGRPPTPPRVDQIVAPQLSPQLDLGRRPSRPRPPSFPYED